MSKIDDGGPAFPAEKEEYGPNMVVGIKRYPGMTLRDWVAGQAIWAAWDARYKGYYEGDDALMAKAAYQIADAMITERKKGGAA